MYRPNFAMVASVRPWEQDPPFHAARDSVVYEHFPHDTPRPRWRQLARSLPQSPDFGSSA